MSAPDQLVDDLRLLEPSQPFHLSPWLLVLIVAIVAVVWWYRRWKATLAARQHAHALEQAHEDALAELEKLFALIDREESRNYALESSAIIRRYIETRFELSAPRRSTEEFLAEAQTSPKLATQHQTALGEFLGVCDLLKFALTRADRAELQHLHEAAVRFVKETKPAPAPLLTAA
jgi:hypothetical protein